MMRVKGLAAAAIVIVLVTSLVTLNARQDPKAAIEKANAQFAATFAKGDAAGLAAMYSSTGEAFPPNGEVARGREALQKLWQGAIASGVKAVVLTSTEVEAHGDTAIEVGTYRMSAEGGKAVDHGKYIVI